MIPPWDIDYSNPRQLDISLIVFQYSSLIAHHCFLNGVCIYGEYGSHKQRRSTIGIFYLARSPLSLYQNQSAMDHKKSKQSTRSVVILSCLLFLSEFSPDTSHKTSEFSRDISKFFLRHLPPMTLIHAFSSCLLLLYTNFRSLAAWSSIVSTWGKAISSSFCAYGVGTSAPVTR